MVVILIPSYKPDDGLLTLLEQLHASKRYEGIVVVDDGSGEKFRPIFDRAEQIGDVTVVRHAVNLGKGRALKTGINAIMDAYPGAHVITADADGQHTPRDICRLADSMEAGPEGIIWLGKRVLGKDTPVKSLFGNTVNRIVFLLITGKMIYDTQTGLRGLPSGLLADMLHIKGERYEYEMNVLLEMVRLGADMKEIEIQTIYINNNSGTHFHPIRDALMVFSRLIAFAASSLISFALDYGAYALLIALCRLQPEFAYIGARLLSSAVNFSINRNLVFGARKGSFAKQILGYYLLAVLVMALGSLGVRWGTDILGWNEYLIKILVDSLLWVLSFMGQRLMVFRPVRAEAKQKARG